MPKKSPKTKKICVVQGNYGYGHGWEDLAVEDTRKECLTRLREYRDNEQGVPFRVIRRRVKRSPGPVSQRVLLGGLRGRASYPRYQFYVVSPEGLIESGWDYLQDARDQIKENAPPGRWRVVTRRGMARLRIDPDLTTSWLTHTSQRPLIGGW